MNIGSICLLGTDKETENYWDYALLNIGPDNIFILEDKSNWSHRKSMRNATEISNISDIPEDYSIVLMAPPTGHNIAGTESLVNFKHPDKAVYIFGLDNFNLEEYVFANRSINSCVYIPTNSTDEMYSHMAAVVTFYSRATYNG